MSSPVINEDMILEILSRFPVRMLENPGFLIKSATREATSLGFSTSITTEPILFPATLRNTMEENTTIIPDLSMRRQFLKTTESQSIFYRREK